MSESSIDRVIAAAEKEALETAKHIRTLQDRRESFSKSLRETHAGEEEVQAPPTPPVRSSAATSDASPPKVADKASPRSPVASRRGGLSTIGRYAHSSASPRGSLTDLVPIGEEAVEKPTIASPKGVVIFGILTIGLVLLQTLAVPGETMMGPPSEPSSEIDRADTAWMLISTAAVLLMIPALGLFEAGLLRAKNAVSVLMQCFAGAAVLSVLWFLIGFSLCFAEGGGFFFGSLWTHAFLANVPWTSPLPAAPTIPGVLFAAFQCMFACITPLLCTGAFAERLRFEAFLTFVIVWSVFVYYPLCHWIWGGGWLSQLGVVDFAGGIVIHTAAGVASLVTAIKLGPRAGFAGVISGSLAPHNIPMAATGAGLLWFGWFGFNAGSTLSSGGLAASTLMTTHIAGATGTLAWLILDWCVTGRPTLVGVINGALSGLAGVTPASGFVPPSAGFVIGLLCGVASYLSVHLFKESLRIDDALDVSSIHGVTGVLGSILIGVYASSSVNADGPEASVVQVLVQTFGVLVAIGWSGGGTYAIMAATQRVMATRIDGDEESKGLDTSLHGESSYNNLQALL